MADPYELLAEADRRVEVIKNLCGEGTADLVAELAAALRAALAARPQPLAIIQSIINEAEGFHAEDYSVLGDEWFLSRLRLAAEAMSGSATSTQEGAHAEDNPNSNWWDDRPANRAPLDAGSATPTEEDDDDE